ncbi:MAG: hypothetical protein HYR74_06165, partial [Candidatus Eisenbacteria bacterium]|nr:hypothetical protein [Candidatus Eisenbacteria bacterium]
MDEPPRLSKSRFTQGLRCHRALWWRVHEPDAPELVPDAEREATFALGHRIGALAREQFPGGVLIDVPHTESEERVRRTAEAMGAGAPAIFEAAFVADGTFVAVDVLERGDDGWRLIEVKSALHVKEAYCDDVAVQFHVVRASGTPVVRAEVMHLNRDCVAPDLSNLFVRDDVTADAERRLARVPELIRGQRTMLAG